MIGDGRYLLDAADSYRWSGDAENRLTAIFAVALKASPSLSKWLVGRVFEEPWIPESITTQHGLSAGGRPDMKLTAPEQAATLYVENKLNARWTRWQQKAYEAQLSSRLLFVSPDGRRPRELEGDERCESIRWQNIADEAVRIGRCGTAEPNSWPASALEPGASNEQRMLAELVNYLQREKDARVRFTEPLRSDDLVIIPKVPQVVENWESLFELVVEKLAEKLAESPDYGEPILEEFRAERSSPGRFTLDRSLTLRWSRGDWSGLGWPALESVLPVTPSTAECWQEIILAVDNGWRNESEPGFAVGVGFAGVDGWPSELAETGKLRATIVNAEFSPSTTWCGTTYRITAGMNLEDLADIPTADDQAEFVRDWALERLETLSTLSALG